MINHIIIPNLKRCEDRWYYMLGALSCAGFDVNDSDLLIRFNAHDGQDYENCREVRDAAIAAGFEFFANYKNKDHLEPERMAWNWTFVSVMQQIANMPDNSVVLYAIDDQIPAAGYTQGDFNSLVFFLCNNVVREYGKFKGLQLARDVQPHIYYPKEPATNSPFVRPGWAHESDHALLLTPCCAQMIIDTAAEIPEGFENPHVIIRHILEKGINDDRFYKGFWHTRVNLFTSRSVFDSLLHNK